jgi:hypothetical protein
MMTAAANSSHGQARESIMFKVFSGEWSMATSARLIALL